MPLKLHKDTLYRFHRRLRRWFTQHRRKFIWRTAVRDPYVVLIAEVMLQQTQSDRVEKSLTEFLEIFPTLEALATATRSQVLTQWSGLGYNSRALRLHMCAQRICHEFDGKVPDTYEQLRKLPGIGDYTARALLAFAFGKDVAVVDVNVRRVLSRIFAAQRTEADVLPLKRIHALAEQLLPRGGARWWNEALMDLGSVVCTHRKPRCPECPLRQCCKSARQMQPVTRLGRSEPMWRNVPRRLWRGRIIELLRQNAELSLFDTARMLWGSPSQEDLQWLLELIDRLEGEGLLAKTNDRMIRLP